MQDQLSEVVTQEATVEEPSTEVYEDGPSSEPTEDAKDLTLAEAFAAAKAELGEGSTEGDGAASEEGSPEPPAQEPATGEAEGQPEGETEPPKTEPQTGQGALDRIQTLVREGRLAELDARERGLLDVVRGQLAEEQKQEQKFRDFYLELLAKEDEDPVGFIQEMKKQPRLVEFMNAYKAAHPDISLDNPDAPHRGPSPEAIREQVWAESVDAISKTIDQMATAAGVDAGSLATLRQQAGDKYGQYMLSAFDTAVKAGVEKMREAVRAEEREAAELEAQAKWAPKTIVTPRQVTGGAPDPGKPGETGDVSMRAAFAEAKRELANAR